MRVTRAPLSTRNIVVMGPAVPHDRSRTLNPSNTPAIVITFPSRLCGLVRHHSTYYVAGMAGSIKGREPDDSVPDGLELASGRFRAQESNHRGPGAGAEAAVSDQAEEFGAVAPEESLS
jgi:hypothetical protein